MGLFEKSDFDHANFLDSCPRSFGSAINQYFLKFCRQNFAAEHGKREYYKCSVIIGHRQITMK